MVNDREANKLGRLHDLAQRSTAKVHEVAYLVGWEVACVRGKGRGAVIPLLQLAPGLRLRTFGSVDINERDKVSTMVVADLKVENIFKAKSVAISPSGLTIFEGHEIEPSDLVSAVETGDYTKAGSLGVTQLNLASIMDRASTALLQEGIDTSGPEGDTFDAGPLIDEWLDEVPEGITLLQGVPAVFPQLRSPGK